MNRKILAILLAVMAVLCLTLGACASKLVPAKESAFKTYIFDKEDQAVKDDFILPATIGTFKVKWTSNNDNVVLEKRESDYLAIVTIPEEKVTVTLTADLGGVKKEFTVRLLPLTVQDFIDSYSFTIKKVVADFELDKETTYYGKTATISWSVQDELSKAYIAISEDGYNCLVTPSSLNPEVKLNATFTYNGKSATTFYALTVSEEMEHLQEVNYWYTNTGVSITMKGYVVEIATVWSQQYGNVSLYMVDENFDAGYYLYRVKCDAENAAKLECGVYVTCSGTTNTNYSGLIETNAGGSLVVDETKKINPSEYVYAIDNDVIATAPASLYNQSRLVSVSNWKVASVAEKAPTAGSNSTLFTLEKGGEKVAVAVSKYLEGAYTPKEGNEQFDAFVELYKTVKAKFDAKEEVVVSVSGLLGNYNGAQILPLKASDVVLGGTVGENDDVAGKAVKAAMSKVEQAFDLPLIITSNKTLNLEAKIGDVDVSYRLIGKRNSFVLENNTLTITPGAAEVATVEATYSINGYTAKTFHNMHAENLSDEGKANWELKNFKVESQIKRSGTFDLPQIGFFDDATVVWTSDADYVKIEGNKLTILLPDEATSLKLTATVKVNGVTATEDYYINVSAKVKITHEGTLESPYTVGEAITIGVSKDKFYFVGVVDEKLNETYGNTYIKDELGNRMQVYGLYSFDGTLRYDAFKDKTSVKVGDTIVVYGNVSDYKGNLQFKNVWLIQVNNKYLGHAWNDGEAVKAATCTEDGEMKYTCTDEGCTETKTEVIKATGHKDEDKDGKCDVCNEQMPEEPTSNVKTVAEALLLEDGADVVLTGVVESIDVAWSEQYKNISVYLKDETGSILLYRLATKVEVGDKITVTGKVGSDNGVKQIANGATAVIESSSEPSDKVEIEEVSLADFLAKADSTEVFYKISGVVVEIKDTNYGNIYITDGTTIVYVYGLCAEKMTLKDGKWVNSKNFSTLGLEVGTYVTLASAKGSYNGNPQAVGSGLLEKREATGAEMAYVNKYAAEKIVEVISVPQTVAADIELNQNATWTSNNAAIVIDGTTGKVTRGAEDVVVTLTAAVTIEDQTATKEFTVTVQKTGDVAVSNEAIVIKATDGVSSDDKLSISWAAENFTLTNNKANSTIGIRTSDSDHFRAYKNSELVVAAKDGKKITKIVFTCTSGYASALKDSVGESATVDGLVVTITVSNADSLTITLSAQVRFNKIEVYYV